MTEHAEIHQIVTASLSVHDINLSELAAPSKALSFC